MDPFDKEQQARTTRVVIAAIEDGLARMHDVHARMLIKRPGGKLTKDDLRWLRETENALAGLAGELADSEVFAGEYGKLLKASLEAGAKASSASAMIRLDADTIRTALYPARLEIKGLFDDGAQAITELTSKAMTAGWSPRELSLRIQGEVVLYDQDGSPYGVPKWCAELQARNEPMKVYREAAGADWTDETLLEMLGPDDARTAGDICSDYVGKVKTLAEWESIVVDAKSGKTCQPRGGAFHPNCRHRFVRVQEA